MSTWTCPNIKDFEWKESRQSLQYNVFIYYECICDYKVMYMCMLAFWCLIVCTDALEREGEVNIYVNNWTCPGTDTGHVNTL